MKFKKTLLMMSLCFTPLVVTGCRALTPEQADFDIKTKEVYHKAVEAGFQGTYEEWLATIKGEPGKDGATGPKGDKGDQGAIGPQGPAGQDGQNGTDGKSAYELYKEAHPEYTKSEQEWLDDLVNGRLGVEVRHKVFFDTGYEEKVLPQNIKDGEKVTKPNDLVRENYIFKGWFYNGNLWNFETNLCLNDMTLVAKWEYISSDYDYVILPDGTAKLTTYKGTNQNVIVPEHLGDIVVSTLGANVFKEKQNIISVVLPDTVTTVEDYAFLNCTNLTSVEFGNDVQSYGIGALMGCQNLATIGVPNNVNLLQFFNFSKELLPKTLKTIKLMQRKDRDNTRLLKDVLFSGIESHSDLEFNVELQEGFETVRGFNDCWCISSVKINVGAKAIENNAFSECVYIKSFTLSNTVVALGDYFFAHITVPELFIPKSVKYIGSHGSNNGYGPKKVIYYEGTKEDWNNIYIAGKENNEMPTFGIIVYESTENDTKIMEDSVFKYVKNFNEIYILECKDKNIETIDLVQHFNNLTIKYLSGFDRCEKLRSITIPDTITTIEEECFESCIGLKSVSIPSSVNCIKYSAFNGCTGLVSITLPDTITEIGDSAFAYCTGLTSIKLPSALKTLSHRTFYWCSHLKSITLPNTLTEIGESCFDDCTALSSINLPNTLKSIKYNAFKSCSSLTSIFIPKSVVEMGPEVFNYCSNLTTINCEVSSKPSTWDNNWNMNCNATVNWGYKAA